MIIDVPWRKAIWKPNIYFASCIILVMIKWSHYIDKQRESIFNCEGLIRLSVFLFILKKTTNQLTEGLSKSGATTFWFYGQRMTFFLCDLVIDVPGRVGCWEPARDLSNFSLLICAASSKSLQFWCLNDYSVPWRKTISKTFFFTSWSSKASSLPLRKERYS